MSKRKQPPVKASAPTQRAAPFPPKSEQQRRFCEEYVKDQRAEDAALRAGYAEKTARHKAHEFVKRHHDYIQWLLVQQAQANAKVIAIELETVLQEIAKIAFVNEYDYLVIEASSDPKQPPKVRRKRLDELTREQMVPITVKEHKGGVLSYQLREKEDRLVDLVRHLGGFSEKIILEHRHKHLHAHLDLTNVPLEQLETMESMMWKLIEGRTRGAALEVK